MGFRLFVPALFFLFINPFGACSSSELRALLEIKSALDPKNEFLSSWIINGDPCDDGSFEGLACNDKKQVANISLQGKGLSGQISPAIGKLKHLTGLFLHYNSLRGQIPREIGNLSQLSDLYLNANNLSGEIPIEISDMENLQVLQLCYNQLTGSIPRQLGSLKKLSVIALESNHLSGAIPASLGNLRMLIRLDLSFNDLFGSIPIKLTQVELLQLLDIRNNTLSGNVPSALQRLNEGFQYGNNLGLCGEGFMTLKACALNHGRPEQTREIPESANLQPNCNQSSHCSRPSKSRQVSLLVGVLVLTVALSAILLILTITHYRRGKQKLGCHNSLDDTSDARFTRKNGSLKYSSNNGCDRLSNGQDSIDLLKFNLDEVETATQYFSKLNLLGKSSYSVTYRGILRDGSAVLIKSISKSMCKSEESELLKELNVLGSIRHENLVRLRGFCCSSGQGDCFLIYDFIPNGNLLRYLDIVDGEGNVLEWSARVSIAKGLAKGIAYLHGHKVNKYTTPCHCHQNICAAKILIDHRCNPLLSACGLHNLVTNDVVFAKLKSSADKGYLAPEYTTTGRLTEKSDVYAFGFVVFQLLSGKENVTRLVNLGAESCQFQDYIDSNLHGRFFEYEATKLARIAWLCTHESPIERPSMQAIVQQLSNCTSCL